MLIGFHITCPILILSGFGTNIPILNQLLTIHRSEWTNPPTDKHIDFISEVIVKCIRLSYYDRIEKTLPTDMMKYLPPRPEPNFRFLHSTDTEGTFLVTLII